MRREFHELLRSATSERGVVQLARSYLANWTPHELAGIPDACRPGQLAHGEDVADMAYALRRARIASSHDVPELEEMEAFFVYASNRLSELEAPQRTRARSYLTR